ncbi:MAG: apolipoprotein N-acyltransferase [Alphaproteobacteria bacterium]|nr:apolipoprotein N-acyltransferase [Alphaproteobacteria bacterium]
MPLDHLRPLTNNFWKKSLTALIIGCLASLSMAPLSAWPILFISFPTFYALLSASQNKKQAFALGWLFGFGYFVCSLSWIGNALLVEGNPYKWAWPLAVSGLPALLAFFPAIAALLTRITAPDLKTIRGTLAFLLFFSAAEIARGTLFTGFPWNLYGYTWISVLEIAQTAHITTAYGLSALTIFWAASPAFVLLSKNKTHKTIISAASILTITLSYAYGFYRLNNTPIQYHKDMQVLLVQPNIKQSEKWSAHKIAAHFAMLLEMSQNTQENNNKTTYIIWPETAISSVFLNDKGAMNALRAMLYTYPSNAALLTGALIYNPKEKSYTNSLILIGKDGNISNIYNKHHLVPFGEYIPFQKWIPLQPVVEFTGFKKGNGLQTFETQEGLRYSPLVCYEIIFPGRVVHKNQNTDVIINVTNDGWYGNSAGPYQHLTQARFRAIETGIPVIRVANTGISAIINSLGETEYNTHLSEKISASSKIPLKIN